MAIATPESYADMLDRAKAGKYAIPAINVTSSQTLSAALKGFADAESDGIVQISNGGAAYWSGSSRADKVKGSIAFAAYARAVGDLYPRHHRPAHRPLPQGHAGALDPPAAGDRGRAGQAR